MATTSDKNVASAAVDSAEFEVYLEGLDFHGAKYSQAARKLEALRAQISELETTVSAGDAEYEARHTSALHMVRKMKKANISDTAIKAALQVEFVTKRPTKTGEERQSHKISDEDKGAIKSFLMGKPDGVLITEVWAAFPALDQVGVTNVVKALVEDGTLQATGKTRSRKYAPASAKAA